MLGNSLFWASAAVLRLLLVAWAPVVLLTTNASDVADLTLFLALGMLLAGSLRAEVPGHDLLAGKVVVVLMETPWGRSLVASTA